MTNLDRMNKEELIELVKKLQQRKKYGLVWDEEKTKEQFEKESENALPVLKEVKGKEIKTDPNKPTNILIEGDNYHALSVLNFTHQSKIDVIYIDPPYNTGNKDFAYNDKFVDPEDPFRHSKWLSFMEKRLKLARNVLKQTGVIFISIDDHEQAPLKLLCDEIFGENNFINTLIWKKKGTSTNVIGAHISSLTEYILCYGKSAKAKLKPRVRLKETREYSFSDKEGKYRKAIIEKKNAGSYERASMQFKILGHSPRAGKRWQIGENKARGLEANNRFVFEDGIIKLKIYDFEDKDTYSAQPNLLEDCGSTQSAQQMLDNIIGKQGTFDNPKPIELIQKLTSLVGNGDSIILDFMAGSGTTGHAVLELNKEDGGNRQFILCTNNENGIAQEVCYPRINAVIKGHTDYADITGIESNLKYFKTAFVKNSVSRDDLKIRLTRECTEMLCLREGIYGEKTRMRQKKSQEPDYRIFGENSRIIAVYYPPERGALKSLKKDLDKLSGEKVLYCFTLDPVGLDEKEFADWKDVRLEPIPQKILDVYKTIM